MTKVGLAVIMLAALPGILVIAASMGNAVQVLNQLGVGNRYSNKQINNIFSGMKRQKLIEYIADKNGKTIVRITKKGQTKLRAFEIDLIKIKNQPNKWDGKWRIVMFDLPIRFNKAREALAVEVKRTGFTVSEKVFGYILIL